MRRLTTVASLILAVGACVFFVVCRVPYHDEGWYVYAGLSVHAGKLPYRDFCYTQAPLLPYLYSLSALAPAAGLWTGRILSAMLGLAACVLTVAIARRDFGPTAAWVSALLLGGSVHAMGHYAAALTYGPTVFLLALSLWAAFGKWREPWRTLAALAFGVAAAGVRLSAVVVVPVLIGYLAWRGERRARHAAWSSAYAVLLLAATFGPFVFGRLDVAAFEMVGFHLGGEPGSSRVMRMLTTLGWTLLAYGVVISGALLCLWQAWRVERFERESAGAKAVTCAAATVALLLVHLVPATTDVHYFAALAPVAALGAGYGWAWASGWLRWRGLAIGCLAAAHALGQVAQVHRERLVATRPCGMPTVALRSLDRAGLAIAEHSSRHEPILTLNPTLAIHAQRPLMPGLEMSTFAFRPDWDDAACQRHHVVNWPILIRLLGDARVAALGGEEMKRLARGDRGREFERFKALLRKRFRPAAALRNVGQFRDTLVVFVAVTPSDKL